MNDRMKSRLAIDLDALEKQLTNAHAQPASSRERSDDPLSELARIVGQDDPFRTLLANERPRRSAETAPTLRPHAGEARRHELARAEPQAEPRPFAGSRSSAATPVPASVPTRYPQPVFDAPPARGGFQYPTAADSRAAAAALEPEESNDENDEYAYTEDEGDFAEQLDDGAGSEDLGAPVVAKRSRKGVIAVGAVLSVAVIGVAAALGVRGVGGRSAAGEPPVIKADTAPTKIQPQNPVATDVASQNNQIYERSGQPTARETKVVDRSEQPVDVNQTIRRDTVKLAAAAAAAASLPAIDAAPPLQAPNPALALGEPKRVKTVAVKPDGSLMSDVGPAAQPPTKAAALPTAAPKPTTTTPVTPAAQPKPARIVEASEAAEPNRSSPGTPLSITPLADRQARPAQRQVATAPVQEIASPASTASTNAPTGSYAVQLAAPGSEKEARDIFANLQRKYAADLSGHQPIVRRVETGGRTIYRLRIDALTRESATSLCNRLQAGGGACFVAKN